jgi:hypothetical protein
MTEQPPINYAAPVSELLKLGDDRALWSEPEGWLDYRALYGFSQADVPELIRMATDPALWDLEHLVESDESPVYFYAPYHAIHALARLQAGEAVLPLLEWLNDAESDSNNDIDWMLEQLDSVFHAIGEPVAPTLIQYVMDETRHAYSRATAGDALTLLVKDAPDLRADVINAFSSVLSRTDHVDRVLNAFIINALLNLGAEETLPITLVSANW